MNEKQKQLEKELKEHWENTKEEREKTHTSIMFKKHLNKLYKKRLKEIKNA